MTAPRYAFTGSGTAWALTLGDVTVLSASSQARATGEVVARLVALLNEALDDYEDAELAATRLAAWNATVPGRAGGVAS